MRSDIKKILLLYTGGTIGIVYNQHGLLHLNSHAFQAQLANLAIPADTAVEVIEYLELVDSSDITLQHWQQILLDIQLNYIYYDGFIIVHGTDTMAYTASVLAFALQNLTKPVILTGSQLPLVHRRSDGWTNLSDAICAASIADLHEVAIVFNHKLLRGCRAQKTSTYRFFGFDSIDEAPLADFGVRINLYKQRWLKRHSVNNSTPISIISLKNIKIVDLSLRPGFTTDFITQMLSTQDLSAVVLQTYGSGNIPAKNTNLLTAITDAVARGVIIVSITQVIEGLVSHEYINSSLSSLGIINGYDMTVEATLAKLLCLLSCSYSTTEINKLLGTNVAGELTIGHADCII